jgi:hypothetical protein
MKKMKTMTELRMFENIEFFLTLLKRESTVFYSQLSDILRILSLTTLSIFSLLTDSLSESRFLQKSDRIFPQNQFNISKHFESFQNGLSKFVFQCARMEAILEHPESPNTKHQTELCSLELEQFTNHDLFPFSRNPHDSSPFIPFFPFILFKVASNLLAKMLSNNSMVYEN